MGWDIRAFRKTINIIMKKQILCSLYLLFSILMTGNVIAQNLTITDFGAKGDEITNNTEAIQKAINKANELGGGVVIVPKGVFTTDPLPILWTV
jgi:hypothetical protein